MACRWQLLLLLLLVPFSCCQLSVPAPVASPPLLSPVAPPSPALAPLLLSGQPVLGLDASNATVHRYIVVLYPNASAANVTALIAAVLPSNASVHSLLIVQPALPPPAPGSPAPPSFNAFSAFLSPEQLRIVRSSPLVSYVEEDGIVSLDTVSFSAVDLSAVQDNPYYCWGLNRIAQRHLPLSGQYAETVGQHGEGVTIYFIDTGCLTSHVELTPRASLVYSLFDNGLEDQQGHGTHVAGTAGGLHVGVANRASIGCLAVLDSSGSGTYSDVVGAMQWIQQHASRPAVMSMSLGGSFSQAVNDQTAVLIATGISCVSASGNSGSGSTCQQRAGGVSPASTPGLMVAASSNRSDSFSSFDNYGDCVSIIAPGEEILSAWGTGDEVYAIASGTSMAAPHVAGVAALYLNGHQSAVHAEVKASVECSATVDVLSNAPPDTSNRLLYEQVMPCAAASSSSSSTAMTDPTSTATALPFSSSSSSSSSSSALLLPAVGPPPTPAPPSPPDFLVGSTVSAAVSASNHTPSSPDPKAWPLASTAADNSNSSSSNGSGSGSWKQQLVLRSVCWLVVSQLLTAMLQQV